eukprot:TRINITY_DN1678_c0_g1_i2.p1 TRINITY_DN1678_c0_g1~~TRINITY_DN1678_c0_g1_i2.p1  ORF type:complete len:175 (+),score=59.34 TRINITY_DN1678_c0_g1_i2:727-1251(+)
MQLQSSSSHCQLASNAHANSTTVVQPAYASAVPPTHTHPPATIESTCSMRQSLTIIKQPALTPVSPPLPRTHITQDVVIEALFSGYFEQGAKLSSVDELVRVAEAAGVSGDVRAYLESGEDEDAVMREAFDGARRLGITGVPFFVIARDGNKERLTLSGAQPVDVFDEAFDALR